MSNIGLLRCFFLLLFIMINMQEMTGNESEKEMQQRSLTEHELEILQITVCIWTSNLLGGALVGQCLSGECLCLLLLKSTSPCILSLQGNALFRTLIGKLSCLADHCDPVMACVPPSLTSTTNRGVNFDFPFKVRGHRTERNTGLCVQFSSS